MPCLIWQDVPQQRDECDQFPDDESRRNSRLEVSALAANYTFAVVVDTVDNIPKNGAAYGVNVFTTVCTALLVPFTVLCATFLAVTAVFFDTCRAVRTGPA